MEVVYIKHPILVCDRVKTKVFCRNKLFVFYYELIDPVTDEICYIGQTEHPNKRIKQHYKTVNSYKGNSGMTEWITSLDEIGLLPIMRIIIAYKYYWCRTRSVEEKLIKLYWKNGHPLLNRSRHLLGRKNNKERIRRLENSCWALSRNINKWTFR